MNSFVHLARHKQQVGVLIHLKSEQYYNHCWLESDHQKFQQNFFPILFCFILLFDYGTYIKL